MPAEDVGSASILIVDDEDANVELLEAFLAGDGYTNLTSIRDPREVLSVCESIRPDLILLDLHMPHLSGFDVMEQVSGWIPKDDFVPILVLTADATPEVKLRALAQGATDFLTKPLDEVEVLLRIRNLLETRFLFHRAQQATRARDGILSVVAHDLRNPLSTIRMAATVLLDDAPPTPSRRPLEIIQNAVQRMDRLIEDLLEVKRIETGKLKVERRTEDLGRLLDEAAGLLGPLASARSIRLEVRSQPDLPGIPVDSTRILQVLSNLVGNAIKFTPLGGSIQLACKSHDAGVVVTVADTGSGIPPDLLPHVFRHFWQASDSDKRGIGLGLSIARGIVEAHGGRIWVESTPGVGTTFSFTLPLTPVDPPPNQLPSILT